MIGFSFSSDGKLVAAVVTLVDAVFGVLVVIGVVHVAPSESLVTVAVTIAFNAAAYILALIQHRQAVMALHYSEARLARDTASRASNVR